VDKPPAMPTHPYHGHFDDTLANGLAWIFQERGKPFVFRPINRLDKDTSGLVLIAKDKQTAHLLAHQMEKREIHKTYLALLTGAIQPTEGEIHTFIRRKEKSIILREATDFRMLDSDEALTYYKTISSNSEFSLVRAIPHTGRTHQLRVHFSYVGHPIVGDSLYGTPSEKIGRHALHAFSLSFLHPITKEPLYWESKLPTDMQEICQKCHFSLPTEAIPSDFR
jgi:23S rRNA pseudouridine1911/1915/1917 synthase